MKNVKCESGAAVRYLGVDDYLGFVLGKVLGTMVFHSYLGNNSGIGMMVLLDVRCPASCFVCMDYGAPGCDSEYGFPVCLRLQGYFSSLSEG